jgi:hypothetical protein
MKKIYVISEENHSNIGIVENIENAIKFLFEEDWIDAYTEYYIEDVNCYYSLWIILEFKNTTDLNYNSFMEKMSNKSEEEILDFLMDLGFYIREEKIWEPK